MSARSLFLATAVALLLAGCATDMPGPRPPGGGRPPPPLPGPDRCDAGPAQFVVGQTYSRRTSNAAQRAAGARVVRRLAPDQPTTREYLAGRLNIVVGARGRIQSLRCG